MNQLIFLPGLFNMVIFIAAIMIALAIWENVTTWIIARRRRKRDRAANYVLEAKRHDNRSREYLAQVEADLRLQGIAIDSGFLASLSGDKYVN